MPPTELGVPWWIYVGSTGAGGKGIHLFQMKTSENPDIPEFVTMTPLGLVAQTSSPSFIAVDARRALLFAVNEIDRFEGKPSGSVSAFAVQRETGKLTLLGQWASMGVRPGHLALARDGKHLLVANDGGSVAVLPVAADGKLGPATDVRQHGGKGRPRGVPAWLQPRQPLRLRLRPGAGPGDRLPVRRRRGQAVAEPVERRAREAGRRSATPGVPPRRQVRLRRSTSWTPP